MQRALPPPSAVWMGEQPLYRRVAGVEDELGDVGASLGAADVAVQHELQPRLHPHPDARARARDLRLVICDLLLHWLIWLLAIAIAYWVIAAELSAGTIAK